MNFLKSFAFSSLLILAGIASCSTKPNTAITTVATPLHLTKAEAEAESRRQAALDRSKIELLKKIAIDENRVELERCIATNPKHQRNHYP